MKKFILITLLSFICCNNSKMEIPLKDYTSNHQEALLFCKEKNFNENYYFLIDMSIHPGKNRFFVYDFKEQKIVDKILLRMAVAMCWMIIQINGKRQNSIIRRIVIVR